MALPTPGSGDSGLQAGRQHVSVALSVWCGDWLLQPQEMNIPEDEGTTMVLLRSDPLPRDGPLAMSQLRPCTPDPFGP